MILKDNQPDMAGPVRSVSQALAILRLLAQTSPLSLSEIGRTVGLSPSSCLNLLRTLVEEGAIERDGRGKRYQLAPAWARCEALKEGVAPGFIERARPLIAQFAQVHDAAIGLWQTVPQGRLQLIAHAESVGETRIHLVEGQRQPLGGGATGRALAAAQQLESLELAQRFAAVRWQIPLSLEEYLRQVAQVADAGFAIDDGYAHAGICSVAVALPRFQTGFCLSASIFAGSRSGADVEVLGKALAELAANPAFSR